MHTYDPTVRFTSEEEIQHYLHGMYTWCNGSLTQTDAVKKQWFRKTAFELYAEKGYHKGFLPYVSNQYAADALAEGSKTYSSWFKRDVALVTDELVFRKIFNNSYINWTEFKKDMFSQRISKQNNLKTITIQYELGKPNSTTEVTISSA